MGFNERVFKIIEKIPAGTVATYGQIARLAGKPNAARFVGYASNNKSMHHLPWHRVVFADGHLCPGWESLQYKALKSEGVTFTHDKKVDLKKHQWSGAGAPSVRPPELKDAPLVF